MDEVGIPDRLVTRSSFLLPSELYACKILICSEIGLKQWIQEQSYLTSSSLLAPLIQLHHTTSSLRILGNVRVLTAGGGGKAIRFSKISSDFCSWDLSHLILHLKKCPRVVSDLIKTVWMQNSLFYYIKSWYFNI